MNAESSAVMAFLSSDLAARSPPLLTTAESCSTVSATVPPAVASSTTTAAIAADVTRAMKAICPYERLAHQPIFRGGFVVTGC